MKRVVYSIAIVIMTMCMLCGCGDKKDSDSNATIKTVEKKPSLDTSSYYSFNLEDSTLIKDYKVALLSEKDKKDNLYVSANEGLTRLNERLECEIVYEDYESNEDFSTKVKELIDNDCKMIWVLGYMAEDINTIAREYPEVNFAVADEYYETIEKNVILINFKMGEASFFLGYIAAIVTSTNNVGIIYVNDNYCNEYIYGFKAGVYYAANESGKAVNVELIEIPAESIDDKEYISVQTNEMINKGCDIIYAANEDVEEAVASAVTVANKYIIGISDSVTLVAANNTLSYPVKKADSAVELVSFHAMSGNDITGVAYEYGLSEGALDVNSVPEEASSMVESQIGFLKEILLGGELAIPADEAEYQMFTQTITQ